MYISLQRGYRNRKTKTIMATSSSLGPAGSNNTPGASGGVVVWEWLNEFGRWCQYDPEIVAYIENMGHISPQVPLGAVSQGLRIYLIDIPSMCQVRQGTGTCKVCFLVFSFSFG